MRKIVPFVQIITGTLLVILIINDFSVLLFEYLFNLPGVKLPIKFSPGGWEIKYWMMDHEPVFSLYQISFMGTGMLLIFLAVFEWLGKKIKLAIAGGLIMSALMVLLFPYLHELLAETPVEFMIAQILAGLSLLPAIMNSGFNSGLRKVALFFAAFLCALLLLVSLIKTPITLTYSIWPIIGLMFLILRKNSISPKL